MNLAGTNLSAPTSSAGNSNVSGPNSNAWKQTRLARDHLQRKLDTLLESIHQAYAVQSLESILVPFSLSLSLSLHPHVYTYIHAHIRLFSFFQIDLSCRGIRVCTDAFLANRRRSQPVTIKPFR